MSSRQCAAKSDREPMAVEQKRINTVRPPAALPPCSAVSLRLTDSGKSKSEAAPPDAGPGAAWRNFRTIGKAKPFRTARRQSRVASTVNAARQSRVASTVNAARQSRVVSTVTALRQSRVVSTVTALRQSRVVLNRQCSAAKPHQVLRLCPAAHCSLLTITG